MDTDERKKLWLEDEARVRTQLAAPGLPDPARMRHLSGLEIFERLRTGQAPAVPIGALIGFFPVEWEEGRFVFQGTPGPQHYNPLGVVHGGYAATLLDSCVGCAVHTLLPAGRAYTTLELKVNYVRPLTERTGPVRAEGKVIHLGRQTAIAEGRLEDAAGTLYAFATTTCLIFEAR